MLPGTYRSAININTPKTLDVVATGSTLRSATQAIVVDVKGGANVQFRGLDIDSVDIPNTTGSVECSGLAGLPTTISLRDAVFKETVMTPRAFCTVKLRKTEHRVEYMAVDVQDDGAVDADRVMFRSMGYAFGIMALSSRMNVRVTNSIFDGDLIVQNNRDTAPSLSRFYYGFNTFVITDNPSPIVCGPQGVDHPRVAIFENNIFYSASSEDVIEASGGGPDLCTFVGNITFPQSAGPYGTNLHVDPRLVDPAAKDFRPAVGSPAIDAAQPSAGPNLDHDFLGSPRPSGSADIGAFEVRP